MAKAPEQKPQPELTPEQKNRRLWDKLGKTDPSATKAFKRGGGFKGTAIKPMWINKRLTETFGPAGIGWGSEEPKFETIIASDGEVLVYCYVAGWYRELGPNDEKRFVFGIGGDKCVGWVGSEANNNRRLVADDEAFKKAYTDALGNAFKFVGVAADVHMGLFDDSKYVQEMEQEFSKKDDELGKEVDALTDQIKECPDLATLNSELLPKARDLKVRLDKDKRQSEGQTLITVFNARLAKLKADALNEAAKPNEIEDHGQDQPQP